MAMIFDAPSIPSEEEDELAKGVSELIKAKRYLSPGEKPPKGATVHQGKRGGKYIEEGGRADGEQKQTEESQKVRSAQSLTMEKLDTKSITWKTEFDWEKQQSKQSNTFGLKNEGTQGMISMNINKADKILEVDLLEANPERRYKGTGSKCMAFAIEQSEKLGYDGEVALIASTKAIPFYEKIGMVRIGNSHRMIFLSKRAKEFSKAYKNREGG